MQRITLGKYTTNIPLCGAFRMLHWTRRVNRRGRKPAKSATNKEQIEHASKILKVKKRKKLKTLYFLEKLPQNLLWEFVLEKNAGIDYSNEPLSSSRRLANTHRASAWKWVRFPSLFGYKKKDHPVGGLSFLEQGTGIEPALMAWEAIVLPIN